MSQAVNFKPLRCRTGFTLIEVLVALAILAIALAAASRAAGMAVDSASETKLRAYATWVAQNHINTLVATRGFPGVGRANGKKEMGGIAFDLEQVVSETPNAAFRKLEVRVLRPGEANQHLVALTAYLVKSSAP